MVMDFSSFARTLGRGEGGGIKPKGNCIVVMFQPYFLIAEFVCKKICFTQVPPYSLESVKRVYRLPVHDYAAMQLSLCSHSLQP